MLRNALRQLEEPKVRVRKIGRGSRKVEKRAEQAWVLNRVIFNRCLCGVVKQEQLIT